MPKLINKDTLLYEAFAVLENVDEGGSETQSPEWNHAFIRFRSRFHARMEIDFTSISLVDKLQDLIDEYGFTNVYKTLNNINILTMEESDGSDGPSEGRVEAPE